MFMCRRHWAMIPRARQNELWAVYVPGQEDRMDPSSEYLEVAGRLIRYVYASEHPGADE
jgi:hypothetical protein